MLFLIIAMAAILVVVMVISWVFLGYDAESRAERRAGLTPQEARIEALENHPSREDGSESFD